MDPSSSSDSNGTTISDNVPDVVDNTTTITTTINNGSNENQPSDSNINTITPNTTITNGGDNVSSGENQVTTSSENSSSTNVDDRNTTTTATPTETSDDPTNSISAYSQKQLIRSGSINRPRKALPRPSHHVPSHSSIDFSFENSNIHQALEKSTHFVIDTSSPHLDDNAATTTTATSTTNTGTNTNTTSAPVQITTTSDSPTATTTTLTSSTSGHHLTSNMTTTQQRRMSHKRSSSDVSGLFGNSSLVSNSTTVASPVTPEKQDSSAPRKKFTLFGFSFGGKSSSNLHSMAPSIPSNSTTPTLANSPITSSSTSTLPTTPIAERGISSLTTTSTDQCITPTTSTLSTTSSSEDSAEIMRKKRASDDVSQEVLKYLSDKPPNRATTIGDEETLKKRQGMHMSQPIGTLGTPEDSNIVGERASRREIDLINFLGEMNLNQSGSYDDTNSTGSRSGIDDIRVATTPESREQTTYGFKSFLDKVRNKAIFARGVGSPADEALTPSSITTDSKTEEDAKSDITTTTTTKTPKKLSEKELRKIKLMERETNQKEMMDGVLDKISKNGESFAHLTFFDENDQEWQYIGYIQKYDSSMTDDELYMMYALLGVGGAEEGATPKTKEKDVKDFTGGIFGDACVCPVLSRLCGRGELRYPNGAIYEGDIIRGKRHGFGKMIFPYKNTLPPPSGKKSSNTEQAPPTAIAIGQWVLNNPSEAIPFKVTYSNELEYWGTFRSKSKFNSAYVISVGDLEKHKEGELYHVQENKKYFGGFSEDLKDGFGVEVMGNGERYYGGWKNGLYHHMGTYQYIDGSYFQGEFKRGCRKGKGKLYLATGDVIEGTWNGDKIENAVFKKGNCKNVELTHLFQLRTQVNDAIKLFQNVGHMDDSNYLQFLRMTKKESIERPELELKWKYYSLMSKETWRKEKTHLLEYYSKNGDKCNLLDKIVFKNEVIKILGETIKTEYISPQVSFVKGFIEFFDSLYHGSYYAGNNRNQSSGARKVARKENGVLLYNAIDDLKSFIIFLCDQVVWEFFGNEIISAKLGSLGGGSDSNLEQQDGQYDDYDDEIIFGSTMPVTTDITKSHFTTVQQAYNFCKTIIADHLHKKLYSTTFELYEYHFRDQDLMINQKINSILTTCSLQNFGVHSDFIPKDVKPYNECIQLMKEIKFSNSVESKIRVLSKLRTLVMHSMKNVKLESKKLKKRLSGELDYENVESDDWQPGADDVTSLYTFSFIKTNLGNYTALFNYVNDWKSPHTSLKPVSHVISFFEGFLAYIMDLDPNLTVKQSELGESIGDGSEDSYVYISKYGLTKQLERAIELAIFRNQSKKEKIERQMQKPNLEPSEMKELTHQQKELQLISFSWVSPLLLFASLQVGHIQLQVNKKAEATQSETTKALAIEVVETTHQNMIVPMVDGSGNMLNLAQALVKYHSLVQSVLESAKLGFNIALKSDKKEGSQATTTTEEKVHHNERIVIEFDKEPFPSYVYSELSLEIAKFIKFELENSDSLQYKI